MSKANPIDKEKINNKENLPLINIDFLSEKLYDICKIVENSEECHLIENSTALFIYHLQYKNLIKKNKVYLHAYARKESNRIAKKDLSNVYIDMFLQPKLENWELIY
jgi:hypothetical protein